ncbi:MAG: hypothetical protein ACLQDY_05695 [Streptosporangiaceae bacterium]
MSALHLSYDTGADRLLGRVQPSPEGEIVQVGQGKLVLHIDRARKLVVAFEISDFRHFVTYHLLDELFGDQVVREIAAFQSAVAANARRTQKINTPAPPRSSRRVVNELLRAA